ARRAAEQPGQPAQGDVRVAVLPTGPGLIGLVEQDAEGLRVAAERPRHPIVGGPPPDGPRERSEEVKNHSSVLAGHGTPLRQAGVMSRELFNVARSVKSTG